MLTHDQLMKTNFVTQNDNVFATNEDGKSLTLIFTKESVHPEFFNILRTAVLLYQTSQHCATMIDGLIGLAEAAGADQIVPAMLNANAATEVVRSAAIIGIEAVVAAVVKNDGSTH